MTKPELAYVNKKMLLFIASFVRVPNQIMLLPGYT